MSGLFNAVFAVSVALSAGRVLQAVTSDGAVSVSHGRVIDWRTVKCGEETLTDVGDEAILFVSLVGEDAALASVAGGPSERPAPEVHAYPERNGDQVMSFGVGPFTVQLSRRWGHGEWTSEAQARFAAELARVSLDVADSTEVQP